MGEGKDGDGNGARQDCRAYVDVSVTEVSMPLDRIRIVNMQFFGHHGVDPSERALGGRFSFDVDMGLDLRAAGEADDLTKTVDYAAVYELVSKLQAGHKFQLLEALAHNIAEAILAGFPVEEVTVRARKHSVPLAGLIDFTEVEITRCAAGRKAR